MAEVEKTGMPDRAMAKEYEQQRTDELAAAGNSLSRHTLPAPA